MSVTESTENRKATCDDLDWSYWQHFKPKWSLGPRERQWLHGTGNAVVARGIGFFLAAVSGFTEVAFGFESILLKQDATGYFYLTVGMTFLVLGVHVCHGKRWACLGLMVLFTLDRAAGNLMAYTHGAPYYTHHLGLWLGEGLLAWAVWMRVFYVTYRVEQQRSAKGTAPPLEATSHNHIVE